jgi:hypothetical protein
MTRSTTLLTILVVMLTAIFMALTIADASSFLIL